MRREATCMCVGWIWPFELPCYFLLGQMGGEKTTDSVISTDFLYTNDACVCGHDTMSFCNVCSQGAIDLYNAINGNNNVTSFGIQHVHSFYCTRRERIQSSILWLTSLYKAGPIMWKWLLLLPLCSYNSVKIECSSEVPFLRAASHALRTIGPYQEHRGGWGGGRRKFTLAYHASFLLLCHRHVCHLLFWHNVAIHHTLKRQSASALPLVSVRPLRAGHLGWKDREAQTQYCVCMCISTQYT